MPQHALRELERLMAENARIEKERQTMESGLIDSSVERDSLRYADILSF